MCAHVSIEVQVAVADRQHGQGFQCHRSNRIGLDRRVCARPALRVIKSRTTHLVAENSAGKREEALAVLDVGGLGAGGVGVGAAGAPVVQGNHVPGSLVQPRRAVAKHAGAHERVRADVHLPLVARPGNQRSRKVDNDGKRTVAAGALRAPPNSSTPAATAVHKTFRSSGPHLSGGNEEDDDRHADDQPLDVLHGAARVVQEHAHQHARRDAHQRSQRDGL